MTQFYAVLHDGTMDGDCNGDPCTFIAVPNMDVEFDNELIAKWTKQEGIYSLDDYDTIEQFIEDEDINIVGGWVVSEQTKTLINRVVKANGYTGSDYACYAVQRIIKCLLDELCVKRIGQLPVNEDN